MVFYGRGHYNLELTCIHGPAYFKKLGSAYDVYIITRSLINRFMQSTMTYQFLYYVLSNFMARHSCEEETVNGLLTFTRNIWTS